jgi:predicted ATPase
MDYPDIDENDFDDNNFFEKKLTYIQDSGVKELTEKAAEAELEWEDRFQNQVLGQLLSQGLLRILACVEPTATHYWPSPFCYG